MAYFSKLQYLSGVVVSCLRAVSCQHAFSWHDTARRHDVHWRCSYYQGYKMIERILFVCVGNICRSPMAEAILKHRMANKGLNIQISSAGLAALSDKSAS